MVSLLLSAAIIEPQLAAKLQSAAPSQKFKVIAYLREQPDYEGFLRMYSSKARRTPQVVKSFFRSVKDLAERTQPAVISRMEALGITEYRRFWIRNMIAFEATPSQILAIAEDPAIARIAEDKKIYLNPMARPKDPADITPDAVAWGVQKIMADSVWINLGYDGSGVLVGSMDSGVMADHPALSGKVVLWYDPRTGSATPTDDAGCYYHGTHTTGTILGGDGLGSFSEDIGVAPGATIAMVRIFGTSSCDTYTSTIHDGFQMITSWKVDSGYDIVAVNNSWGSASTTNTEYWDDVLAWRSADIIPVFSIGNSGPSSGTAGTPGNFPTVIGVGATDNSDVVASFSSRGPAPNSYPWNDPSYWPRSDWNYIKPNISAPGVSIYSSYGSSSYTTMDGTSMASPHVTGAIALLFQRNPNLDFTTVYNALLDYSDHYGSCATYPNNDCGWGRLNVWNTIQNIPTTTDPYLVRDAITVDDAAGNNDGVMDPGETVNLIITLRNSGGADANSTTAILSTTSPYVSITDNSSSYGDITVSSTADNSSDPFVVEVSPTALVGFSVPFEMYITANGGAYTDTITFTLTIGTPVDEILIDTGDAALTLNIRTGGIGWDSPDQNSGVGFVYPEGGSNLLYYGGVAFGNSATYVPDSWYDGGDLVKYWGGVVRSTPLYGDENGAGGFSDAGHPSPLGIRLDLEAYAYDAYRPNWVFLRYTLINEGSSTVNNLYLGIFADFDVLSSDYNDDYVGVDTTLNLVYIYDPDLTYGGGVAIVDPVPVANLSAIDNSSYVYSGTPDSIKWKFLSGELNQNGTSAADWSVVASAGPFTLAPGDTQSVTFAIVGYSGTTDIRERLAEMVPPKVRVSSTAKGALVEINAAEGTHLKVDIFATDGKLVRRLYDGVSTGTLTLKASDLTSGVYILKVSAGKQNILRKFVVR
ncbi:MAG: S8 family serine peptidase [Thermotogae bacterium]|nr:S8 family serine peptidase [Thermotogota bacterium]